MKNIGWIWSSSLLLCFVLFGCAGTGNNVDVDYGTPTVDYVEGLNVNDAPHQESFLNQLAMNYRSYALYNARTSGHPDVAELFAQKAVSAFSGETPFPETLDNWRIEDEGDRFEIYTAYNELIDEFRNDAIAAQPQLAAEAQAKFDCWISATSSGQRATAEECEDRFQTTMEALRNCDRSHVSLPDYVQPSGDNVKQTPLVTAKAKEERYYPETRRLSAMTGVSRSRDGIVIINNVNVPGNNLVQPVPVPVSQPKESKEPTSFVLNQNITGGSDTINNGSGNTNSCGSCSSNNNRSCSSCNSCGKESGGCNKCSKCHRESRKEREPRNNNNDGYVTREEFIDLMLALRSELNEINARLDGREIPQPTAAPVSVPVSVNVTTPANQMPSQAPIIVNTTTPAPTNQEPLVINTSASAIAPAAAPANINVSNTNASASKTDPVNVDATSATANAPSPVSVNTAVPAQQMPVQPYAKKPEKTIIKVQQIPTEPRQRIMEEIFEIRFDFDKATIKPEYENIIRQLAATTQANKNIKVSVVGHTDTAGSSAYNYALGGRRAEAVQKMLIGYGIPASQIVAVSAGEEDLKVPTPNNTPNAENRRVRVVKEVQYMEQPAPAPIVVEEYTETDDCDECSDE